MDQAQLYFLAAIAGFTIFLGLPVALIPRINPRVSAFLSALSAGVLVFLLVEICAKAMQTVSGAVIDSSIGRMSWLAGMGYMILFAGGFGLGLMSLVAFDKAYVRRRAGDLTLQDQASQTALMIAIGIGLHNFGEGLAIGQEYAQGALNLATMLLIGFGIHNATEGFGIAAPLAGNTPRLWQLGMLGLIGGLPTFVGTIVGGMWTSRLMETLFLSLAAGSIMYVVAELIYLNRRRVHAVLMGGLVLGFFVAYGTELIIDANGNEAGEYPSTLRPPVPLQKPSVSAGKLVYQQNCAVCHGANADGKGPVAATLRTQPRDFSDLTFDVAEKNLDWFDAITYGRGHDMPSWKSRLSEQDRWNVIAYIRTLNMAP